MKTLFTCLLVTITLSAFGQEQEVTIKTTNVRSNVYMLEGQGGNMGLIIGDDGAILIDDQFARLSDKIKASIAELTDKPVRFVINTHLHGDHTGGNEIFAQSGSIILAHENVRTRLSTEQFNRLRNQTTPPRPKEAWPVVTFTESMNLHFNNEDIQIIHTKNGHTDGDSYILFKKANVIHTGDALRTGGFPYVDVSSGGSFQGLIDSTDELANLCNEETTIIQGHGSLSNKEEVIWVRDRLQTIKNILQAGIAEGKSADDLVNEKVLKDFSDWDGGFIKSNDFIIMAYEELSAKK